MKRRIITVLLAVGILGAPLTAAGQSIRTSSRAGNSSTNFSVEQGTLNGITLYDGAEDGNSVFVDYQIRKIGSSVNQPMTRGENHNGAYTSKIIGRFKNYYVYSHQVGVDIRFRPDVHGERVYPSLVK